MFLNLIGYRQDAKNDKNTATEKVDSLNKKNSKIPIILPESIESRRKEFEKYVLSAQERIQIFAKQYQWDRLTNESFFDSVMVFDKKEEYDKTFLKITGAETNIKLPKTYCAALEKRILIVVSPEIYSINYPEGVEDNHYEKLLAHEIAHRLHIRILNNNEDLMGPIWFYEGFAIYAADQFKNSKTQLSTNDFLTIIKNTERGNYEKYSYIFRYFAKKIPLENLVNKAGEKDFDKWLHSFEQPHDTTGKNKKKSL